MVCLVAPVLKREQVESKEQNAIAMNSEDVIFDENFDDEYNLTRLAGGSLIDNPPLFTPNGKYLLIICRQRILVHSTTTGEWIRDLEEFGKKDLIAIEFVLNDQKTLIGCSVTGEIIFWDWKNGTISNRSKLPVNGILKTFTLLNMPNGLFCLITYRDQNNILKFSIINIEKNAVLNCPLELDLNNSNDDIIAGAETNFFHYFAIAQRQNLLIVDYKTWRYKMWKNAFKAKITSMMVHPSELLIATGDENGRIFLYRDIFKYNGQNNSSLYAWHHTPVTSIAFTLSGSGFYSGGLEAVLVKWNINRPNMREYLPRMPGHICHIVVGDKNKKVAVCTAENGIQILDDQNRQICVLQNFTFVYDNKSEQEKFPVGLLLNPVNNTLVANGRYGHLQFFSTYTKSLLFNIDIVMQNKLSTEVNKILYDTVVTTAAFNIKWMATGESWDDQEHLTELRLKFWEYKKENQTYALNTSIELPHEGGIRAIKFSSAHSVDNLLCATLGNDDYVKIWSLESCDDIHRKRKIWLCMAKTRYKDFKALSMDFSVDGSLLAVGYGNTLCVFKSDDLKLRAVLTVPPIYDGSLQKIQICCNEKKTESLSQQSGSHKKIIDLFKNFEQNAGHKSIVKVLQNSSSRTKSKISVSSLLMQNKNSEILFKKILGISELNLFQKLIIFQKLNMNFSVPLNSQSKIMDYLNSKLSKEAKEKQLRNYTNVINTRQKFKAKYRLRKFYSRKNMYQNKVNETLVPLLDLLKIEEQSNDVDMKAVDKPNCNGFANGSITDYGEEVKRKKVSDVKKIEYIPCNLQSVSEIKSVNFGKGEFAHLAIITTEFRVILWNILTLRIQFVLKLSVQKMVVDSSTSLCAALTKNNELYIFLPNSPLYLYCRGGMPEIFSACWVPRKYPKSTSLNLDWQSFSTLYFLTSKQELVYLSSTRDNEIKDSITFVNNPSEITGHSIFDVHSLNKTDKNTAEKFDANISTIGVPGKAEVKSIIQMASHTSAPMNLLCSNLINSFLSINAENSESANQKNTTKKAIVENDSDDETDEVYTKIKQRKKLFIENSKSLNKVEKLRDEKQLKKVLKEVLCSTIEF